LANRNGQKKRARDAGKKKISYQLKDTGRVSPECAESLSYMDLIGVRDIAAKKELYSEGKKEGIALSTQENSLHRAHLSKEQVIVKQKKKKCLPCPG